MRRGRGVDVLRRWWVAKYKLPASSSAFDDSTFGDLLRERYEDLYVEVQDILRLLKTDLNNDTEEALHDRLKDLQKALREDIEADTGDDLIDEWERDIAAGRVPDLNKALR